MAKVEVAKVKGHSERGARIGECALQRSTGDVGGRNLQAKELSEREELLHHQSLDLALLRTHISKYVPQVHLCANLPKWDVGLC